MFRYSRDVKRCGPGTKAGAPVGVVYCLSTSSFFILTLTLGLDVSAFGIRGVLVEILEREIGLAARQHFLVITDALDLAVCEHTVIRHQNDAFDGFKLPLQL